MVGKKRSARRERNLERNSQKWKRREWRERQEDVSCPDESSSVVSCEKRTTPLCVSSKDVLDIDDIESMDMEDQEPQIMSEPRQADHSMVMKLTIKEYMYFAADYITEDEFEPESSSEPQENTIGRIHIPESEDVEMGVQEISPMETNTHERGSSVEAENGGTIDQDRLPEAEAQSYSIEERENTLRRLEGRPASRNQAYGPSRTKSRQSKTRERQTKWEPYDRKQRRPLTNVSAFPSQETLVHDIEAILHQGTTEMQDQTAKHITQIKFREVQQEPALNTIEDCEIQPGAEETEIPISHI